MTKMPDLRSRATTTLVLLCGMNLLDYIDRNILAAVLPQIKIEMELSDTQAGMLSPAFLIAYTLFAPLMGWAGDRYNRIHLLVSGVGLWSLATIGSGFARHLWASRAGAQPAGDWRSDIRDARPDDPGRSVSSTTPGADSVLVLRGYSGR